MVFEYRKENGLNHIIYLLTHHSNPTSDANYMFYRKDVLEHYNLTVPRTWDEFWQVSKVIHGKEYKGKVVYGSCLGRKAGEGAGGKSKYVACIRGLGFHLAIAHALTQMI